MARTALAKRAAASGELADALLCAWRTNNRVNCFLVAHLPPVIWRTRLPGETRRTVGELAAHLHNSRCWWLRTLGLPLGIPVPALVKLRTVTRRQLLAALKRSSAGMEALLARGLAEGGVVPATKAYVWRNLPLDVPHVLSYFVAHEAHHRGQLVMVARQLGHRLPRERSGGLWQWNKRMAEAGPPGSRQGARLLALSGRRVDRAPPLRTARSGHILAVDASGPCRGR